MKRIIAILFIIIGLYSCSISNPSWTNIGSERVYIENCRDTLNYSQLDSAIRANHIYPSISGWSSMRYFDDNKNELMQFTYTKKDTTYIVNKINAEDYVFIKRYLNKAE